MSIIAGDRSYRSLKTLERTGATSRYLNLAAITARLAEIGAPPPPMFASPALRGALILKHRLRADERALFERPRQTATKILIPFERTDLGLGGQSFFVGQTGWVRTLGGLQSEGRPDDRDVAILEALDELPTLDPFVMREQLKRRRIATATGYFMLSTADLERMHDFVRRELEQLVQLACGADNVRMECDRLVNAILAGDDDIRLETLRGALHLDRDEYGEGLFCWRGFLYYKWVIAGLAPALGDVLVAVDRIRLIGPRSRETVAEVRELTRRLAGAFAHRSSEVSKVVARYDEAFAALRDRADPSNFSRFLLQAPSFFQAMGEHVGLLAHVVSYWGFRFSARDGLLAYPEELIDILDSFMLELDA
jgi:hypothetical protein